MGGNILRVGYRMGFNTIEFVTGRVTGRVSKKAKKGDIRLSDNWFSDNCPALDFTFFDDDYPTRKFTKKHSFFGIIK